jgi:hypothetical protein
MKIMPSAFDYALWFVGTLLYFCVIVMNLRNREFTRYLALNIYAAVCVATTAGEWLVFEKYGFASPQYAYFYYYAESILSVLLYAVVSGFYDQLMKKIGAGRRIRMVTLVILGATILLAFSIVQTNRAHLTSRFVVELGRDLNFVGGVLTYILLMSLTKVSAPSRKWSQLVSALGIYFFGIALVYGIRMVHPEWRVLRVLVPVSGVWMALAWTYTFATVHAPERSSHRAIVELESRASIS